MSAVLYVPTYLDGADTYGGGSRFARVMKFAHYYLDQDILEFDQLFCLDNGSDTRLLEELSKLSPKIKIQREKNLARGYVPGLDMPYMWRYFWNLNNLTRFNKIFVFDTDTFVLSRKFANFLNHTNSGWRTVLSPKYNWPDGVGFLSEDAYPAMLDFTRGSLAHTMKYNNTQPAEVLLPFTHVHKEFNVDRYGENRIPQTPEMDCYCQCQVDIEMKFHERET